MQLLILTHESGAAQDLRSIGSQPIPHGASAGVSADVKKLGKGKTSWVEKPPGKIFGEAMHFATKAGSHEVLYSSALYSILRKKAKCG